MYILCSEHQIGLSEKARNFAGPDPGFPRGGHGRIWGVGLQRGHFSVKMYVKTKELGPVGGPCAVRLCFVNIVWNKGDWVSYIVAEYFYGPQNTSIDFQKSIHVKNLIQGCCQVEKRYIFIFHTIMLS